MAEALIGNEVASTGPKRTQTFIVTHDGAGNRLPLMERSFMSFSFGGKHIEDFLLVATLGDRLSKNLYADFEDVTSQYTTIDGLYYWGTRMNGNNLEFTLSTDYMTQNMLDDFKHWFRPGVERDLILAEHPNRFIRARVATPPSMNMIPFGEEVDYTISRNEKEENKNTYKTKTTIYKGDIQLSFTMCEPYWTGILNYMPYPGRGIIEDEKNLRIIDLINSIISVNTLDSKEALKICLEDGIPHDKSLYADDRISLGIENSYTNDILLSTIPGLDDNAETEDKKLISIAVKTKPPLNSKISDENRWAKVSDENPVTFVSYIKTATTDISHTDNLDAVLGYLLTSNYGFDMSEGDTKYLFYGGTAPSKPIMTFLLNFNNDELGYITNPHNSFGALLSNFLGPSYILVGEKRFSFTTPSICSMYNKVLDMLYHTDGSESLIDFKQRVRETIKNRYVRLWLLYCVNLVEIDDEDLLNSTDLLVQNIITEFRRFFVSHKIRVFDYSTGTTMIKDEYHGEFLFNSKTGEAIGKFICRTPESEEEELEGEEIIENVGDMVLSKYLIIEERNYLVDGRIILNNCTEITTNEEIKDLKIIYNNMYF